MIAARLPGTVLLRHPSPALAVNRLQPDILLAGFAGGLWALTYQPPAPLFRRAAATLGSAVVAGYLSPIAVAVLRSALPGDLSREIAQTSFGLLIGLVSQRVIGPAVLRIADRKARDFDHER